METGKKQDEKRRCDAMHTKAVLIGHERHVLQCDAAMYDAGGRGGEGGHKNT
jgi:hypothetical protein